MQRAKHDQHLTSPVAGEDPGEGESRAIPHPPPPPSPIEGEGSSFKATRMKHLPLSVH
jgi:hypothetical protein